MAFLSKFKFGIKYLNLLWDTITQVIIFAYLVNAK